MSGSERPGDQGVRSALFLVDSGPEVGSGHLSRCLSLADEMSTGGWAIAFAISGGRERGSEFLGVSRYPIRDLDSVMRDARPSSPQDSSDLDLTVVDHYGLDWKDEWPLRQRSRRVVVIDDLADRGHDCDILIDQTAGRQELDYRELVPSAAAVLAGTEYALISQAFRASRKQSVERKRSDVRHVFVSLGGSNAQQHSAPLARAVAKALPAATVTVAMTRAATGIEDVRVLEREFRGRVRLLEGTTDLAAEMASADLAVGAGGTTAWERCCLGLPTLVVVLAENQVLVTAELVAAGAARQIDLDANEASIQRLISSLDLEKMSTAAATLCDGLGASRVRAHIEESIRTPGLGLRPATPGDSRFVWTVNNDADARAVSLSPGSIPWESHRDWYERRLGDPDYLMLIIQSLDEPAGVVRFQRNGEMATASVALLSSFRGRGLAADVIRMGSRMARTRWPIRGVDAVIREENVASVSSFQKAGFAPNDRTASGLRRFVETWPPFGSTAVRCVGA